MGATKSDLIRKSIEYLDAIRSGLDPIKKNSLPADSIGMRRDVQEAAGFASGKLNSLLSKKQSRAGCSLDEFYDHMLVIESIGAGRDPVDDGIIKPGDPLSEARVRRSMSFVSGELNTMFDKQRGRDRASFRLPVNAGRDMTVYDTPCTITGVIAVINQQNPDPERVNGLDSQSANQWLESRGLLLPRARQGESRMPSDAGRELGITTETRTNKSGEPYTAVIFNQKAQQYMFDHIDAISGFVRNERFEREQAKAAEIAKIKKEAAVAKNRRAKYVKQAEQKLPQPGKSDGKSGPDFA